MIMQDMMVNMVVMMVDIANLENDIVNVAADMVNMKFDMDLLQGRGLPAGSVHRGVFHPAYFPEGRMSLPPGKGFPS